MWPGPITRGMEVRAENRFQSVEEMAEALFPGEKLFVSEKQYVTGRHREEEKPTKAPGQERTGDSSCTIRCTAGVFSGRQDRHFTGGQRVLRTGPAVQR